jgi:hypothetical protein
MNRIYQSARNVLIWIGHEERDTELAFKALRLLAKTLVDLDAIFADPLNRAKARLCFEAVSSLGAGVWGALEDVFQRLWFERVWIIREVVSAKRASLICGGRRIPWLVFSTAAANLFVIIGASSDTQNFDQNQSIGHSA